jgi:hypothetical protein
MCTPLLTSGGTNGSLLTPLTRSALLRRMTALVETGPSPTRVGATGLRGYLTFAPLPPERAARPVAAVRRARDIGCP